MLRPFQIHLKRNERRNLLGLPRELSSDMSVLKSKENSGKKTPSLLLLLKQQHLGHQFAPKKPQEAQCWKMTFFGLPAPRGSTVKYCCVHTVGAGCLSGLTQAKLQKEDNISFPFTFGMERQDLGDSKAIFLMLQMVRIGGWTQVSPS